MDELLKPEFKVFNHCESLKLLAGEEPLLENLAEIFLEDVDSMMESISQAIDQANSNSLMMASHSMAGLVGNFGADDAFAHAKSLLEKIGKEDQLPNTNVEMSCRELFGFRHLLTSELSDLKDDLRAVTLKDQGST